MATVKLSREHSRIILELYGKSHRNRDDLPYTPEFETLYSEFIGRTGLTLIRHEVWKALSNAGKASRLVRKER